MSGGPAPVRVGVRRADDAPDDVVLAIIEARVVRAELERRLGPLSIDLRTDGPQIGPWQPLGHASWPGSVDLTIDLADAPQCPLSALFVRTVDPTAADVRRRMLTHLSVLPGPGVVTDDAVRDLLPAPARPTDVWLVVEAAGAVSDDSIYAPLLGVDAEQVTELDRWFDTCAAQLPAERSDAEVARLIARVNDLTRQLAELDSSARRAERDAVDHIDDLVAELTITRERLTRSALDAPSTT